MAAETLQSKTTQDLEKDLREKRKELREFRFSIAGAAARNDKAGRTLRRDIARILTELNNR